MTVWRLEWLRLVRSPRALVLATVYVVFGLLGPVLAKYMSALVARVQSGVTIVVPPPTPKDGITNFVSQVSQTGLIVVIVIAAGALAFDARRGLSTFLRTRARNMWQLVLPRFIVNAAAAGCAYTLGTLAAWYETTLLLGSLPMGPVLAGMLCGGMFLVFAVALVTAAASVARSTLSTVGIALAVVLLMPVAGLWTVLHKWLPTTLVNAPVELLTKTQPSDYAPALVVAIGASAVLVTAAVARLRSREV